MNDQLTPEDNIQNNEFILDNEDNDYKYLITRLKEIKTNIILLEKTINS
tara:strand:+ start:667 stop:813 length:147 start_codon:yes stop_codon:yes gene_type:complete